MRKYCFLALLLAACVALSGCALVVKDAEKDAQQVILSVNGETVDKQTFNGYVEAQESYLASMYNYYNQLYAMYGLSYGTPSESELHEEAVSATLENLTQRMVLDQKAAELGLDQLTDEDNAKIAEAVQQDVEAIIESAKSYVDDTLEGDALTEAARAYAEQAGYTEEYYQETEKENAILSKVREYAIKDVAVTEDELKAEYDSRVASAKESYESNLSAYGTSVMNGETVYYAPAGYRYVRQILVGFTEEDSAAISAANNERTSAQTVLTTAQNALTENQDALAAEEATEEEKEALTAAQPELQPAVDEAQAVLDEKAAAAEAALNTAFENIQAKLDEVKEKLAAGEDFEALIEQYNDDPGMATNPNGYAVCEGYSSFDPAFVTAAMALEKVGDVSEPVRSDSYGWYIIRYNAEIPEGEVGLDAVRDLIESELLDEKQDAVYDETVQNWISAADVKSWLDRLAD